MDLNHIRYLKLTTALRGKKHYVRDLLLDGFQLNFNTKWFQSQNSEL